MSKVEGVAYVFQIGFVVQPHKQRCLIDALMSYSRLALGDLSVLIGLPEDKMRAVFSRQDFFDEKEALKLVQCFCMVFGE